MRGFPRFSASGLIFFSLLIFLPICANAQQYKPGANFWGDSDNSLIDGPDVGALAASLAGMDPGYWILLPTSRPRTSKWQDLDGNGIADGPDLGILKAWTTGNYSDLTGNPLSLEAENYNPSVDAGDSVEIRARGPSWNPGKYRPGYGIVYEIRNDLSSCKDAQIYGRYVHDGDTYGYYADMAYEYTAEPSDGGYAQTRVSAPGNCANNSEIVVEVYIPADGEFGVFSKRHPDNQPGPQIIIKVIGVAGPYVIAIDVQPNSASIDEGDTISFSATCTLSDANTVDCTASYGGVSTQWTSVGDLTQLSPPNLFEGNPYGGAGTVTAIYDDGDNPSVNDSSPVTILDIFPPDTFINSSPPNPSNSSEPTFTFSCNEPSCTYECRLDGGGFSACSSPQNYTGLSDSPHTFEVRAIDGGSNVDPTPDSFSWTIDTIPPQITVVLPQDGATTNTTITINIAYSDTGTGIDLNSLIVYHNDVNIASSLTVTASSATGSRTGTAGGNVINAWISDLAGNQSFDSALVMIEDGYPPIISFLKPCDLCTVNTGTPGFEIMAQDLGSGVNWNTFYIEIDENDRTDKFSVLGDSAVWNPGSEYMFGNGSHSIYVQIRDLSGILSFAYSSFTIDNTCPIFDIQNIVPDFTFWGDTVTITGNNLRVGATVNVFFTNTLGWGTTAQVTLNTANTIDAIVPGGAAYSQCGDTVEVWVENPPGSRCNSDRLAFTVGLPYAYIANRGNHTITVINYVNNAFSDTVSISGNPTPWAVDITPDGRYAFVANFSTNNVTVIKTQDNTIYRTVPLRCGGFLPTNPRGIAISPDGSHALVASNNRYLTSLEVRKVLNGDTCGAVTNKIYTAGTAFWDISFSPDGERAVVPAGGDTGYVLEVNTLRSYTTDAVNPQYMDTVTNYQLPRTNAAWRQPRGVGMLPQRVAGTPSQPWWSLVVNNGLSSDTVEHAVLLRLPGLIRQDWIDTTPSQIPPFNLTKGFDSAISRLGERAFITFQLSANIGITGNLEGTATDNDVRSRTQRCGASNPNNCPCPVGTCSCELHKIAYTPYGNKAIATVWYSSSANSKVMVLDAETISLGYGSTTITTAHYTCISNPSPSIIYFYGPEGIAMQPLFDRDKDGISDLIEARNQAGILRGDTIPCTTDYLNPASADTVNSTPTGDPDSGTIIGGFLLPEEGIGYRHFYGSDALNFDNWGTLEMILIIEQVGREWDLLHPDGPRISIGDISKRTGTQFCWWESGQRRCHDSHYNGQDADLRYMRSDGSEANYTFSNAGFSHDLTNELIDLFCKAGVKIVFVDSRSNLQGDSYPPGCTVSTATDHADHFHIRIIDWTP